MDRISKLRPWRLIGWGAAAALLLAPLVAMQFGDEVAWTGGDVLFAALMLGGGGLAFELAIRRRRPLAYRAAMALALGAAILLLTVIGAVGLLGSEANPANLLYLGVTALGAGGALGSGLRPSGMARTAAGMAAAQALIALAALAAGWGGGSSPLEILALNGLFVALFSTSALLFDRSA
ncbi:hypothetical protein [Pseudoroseicyclus tamaricis]|uniref:Uncharacterized protein n=1 Tax=Pseudoroseicyclus tamaricis TaxID=2705421 RepID=A0A6B2JVB5_9RHOB|nr:hypothetical protein [Pseudoroseicyclus tamaricis]NDV00124.1 hypothetical protein [Pseudoroseicyclus tamaricis]